MFLLPYKQTPWGESVVEFILYMLWDLGLKVGHATRSIRDCMDESAKDATILTALVPLALYFFSGRWFVRGIAAGAVKG